MSDWEKSVIASIVHDPRALDAARELLPSDFSGPNQAAWAEVLLLADRSGLDARSLINALRQSPDWERLGGNQRPEDYLAELMTFRGSAIEEYVRNVLEVAIKRAVQRNAALIAAEAQDNRKTADELLDYAEKRILALRRTRNDQSVSMSDLMGIFIPRLDGQLAGTIVPAWLPDVTAVRDIVDYLEATDFMVVAGRPGDGKSSYMRYEAWKAASAGKFVHILNYENDKLEYARYFLAMETGIDSARIKMPRTLKTPELLKIRAAAEKLSRLPLEITTTPRTVAAAVRAMRKKKAERNTGLVILDYIQLLNNGIENRTQDVSQTTAELRAFALDMGVPVLAAAQLSRAIETRNNDGQGEGEGADPQLSDLRESGSLEQDATIVCFPRPLVRPTEAQLRQFPENLDERRQLVHRIKATAVYFHIVKNRNGPIGKSDPVKWLKHLDVYQTLTRS